MTIKPGAIGTETAIPHPATKAGHAVNAQNADCARALVNCRIIPGEKFDDIKATLIHVLADDQFVVKQVGDANPSNPAVIDEELLATIEKTSAEFWPGVPVVPIMSAGATDGLFFAQRRHPNLRPLGPRERRRRRARPRQGRARGGQVVLRRRRISLPPCQAAVGRNLAIGTRRWAALWATGPLSCGTARGRARSVMLSPASARRPTKNCPQRADLGYAPRWRRTACSPTFGPPPCATLF